MKYYRNLSKPLKDKQKKALINMFNVDCDLNQNRIRTASELELCISEIYNIIADEVDNK